MDCRTFEKQLWNSPRRITDEMRNHLEACQICKKTLDDYGRIIGYSRINEFVGDDDYWANFENEVFQKIEFARKDKITKVATTPANIVFGWKQAISISSAAAAAVALLLLAIIQSGKLERPSDFSENLVTREVRLKTSEPIAMQVYSIISQPEVTIDKDQSQVAIEAVLLTDDGLTEEKIAPIQSTPLESFAISRPSRISLSAKQSSRLDSVRTEQIVLLEKMPRIKKLITPDYPPLALKYKKSAEIWMKVLVDQNGKIANAIVIKDSGSNLGFEEEAIKAAYKNEFIPLELGERPVPVWIVYKVKFVAPE